MHSVPSVFPELPSPLPPPLTAYAHPLCLVSEQGIYVHPVPHPCQLSVVALVCACWFARRTAGQACSQGGSTSRLHQWHRGCCTTSGRGGRGRRWGWRRGPWWVGGERRCCQRRHGGQEEALPSITTRTSLTLVTLPTWIRSAVSAGPLPVSRDTHHTQTHPLPRPSVPITAVVRRTNSPLMDLTRTPECPRAHRPSKRVQGW
jgi:hypothetical protein